MRTGSSAGARPAYSDESTLLPSGPRGAQEQITLTIVVRRDDEEGFERYLRELYDLPSTNFHRFPTKQQIVDRFGPSRAAWTVNDAAKPEHWLRALKPDPSKVGAMIFPVRLCGDPALA